MTNKESAQLLNPDEFISRIKFDSAGLVPAIAQSVDDNKVLMLAYMDKEAVKKTLEKGLACYWSRSRKASWLKGETSGHFQHIAEIWLDCDGDTILLKVKQIGPACHTGQATCFFQRVK